MGEPLMYRDARGRTMIDIIKLCELHGIKLNLTTNGSFHSPHLGMSVDQWSRLLMPVLSDVKFSWNGASAAVNERIMKKSNFARQLSNLKQFLAIRKEMSDAAAAAATATVPVPVCDVSVTLQLTFLEENYLEIPKVIELGIDLGVDRIKGHHLWAHVPEMAAQSMRRSNDSIRRWNEVVAQCIAIASSRRLSNGKQVLYCPVHCTVLFIAARVARVMYRYAWQLVNPSDGAVCWWCGVVL